MAGPVNISVSKPTPHRDERGQFAKRPTAKTLTDRQTGDQVNRGGGGGGVGSYNQGGGPYGVPGMGNWPANVEGGPAFLFANGGSLANPMGFPGYGGMYTGTYPVYRFMLQNDYVRLVRAIATADILCNRWEYVATQKGGKKYVSMVKDMLDPIRNTLMEDFFMRGRDMGWSCGEMEWEQRGLRNWLTGVRPLLVDVTECLTDDRGAYTGLMNHVPVKRADGTTDPAPRIAAPYKAFKYTYDSEAGYVYGRSWLENIRMFSFRALLDCEQQMARLVAKITGIQLVITHPAGSFPSMQTDGTIKQVSYADFVDKMIKAIASGSPGIRLPSLALPITGINKIETAKIVAELAQKSLIKADLLNHGTNAPAIEGILSRKKEAIEGIFAGGMRPFAMGGGDGKANTEEHKDTGSKVSQLEDQSFARQCQQLVDAILVLNVGPSARGLVRIVPPSIVDNKRAYIKAFLLAALNDPNIAMEMLRAIDVNGELGNLDIRTTDDGFSVDRIEKKQKDQQDAQLKAKQAAGNGNGKGTTKKPEGGRPTKKDGGQPLKRPQPARTGAVNGNGHDRLN